MELLQLFCRELYVPGNRLVDLFKHAIKIENSARFLPVSTVKLPAWAKTTQRAPHNHLPLHNKFLSHVVSHHSPVQKKDH